MAPAAKAGGKELEELIVEMIEQTFQKMFNRGLRIKSFPWLAMC